MSNRDMIGLLEKHYFGAVMLDFDLESEGSDYYAEYYMTQSMRAALRANYRLAATLGMPEPEKIRRDARFYVWVPRTGAPAGDKSLSH